MSQWKSKLDAIQQIKPLFGNQVMHVDNLPIDNERSHSKNNIFSYLKSKIKLKQKTNTNIDIKANYVEPESVAETHA